MALGIDSPQLLFEALDYLVGGKMKARKSSQLNAWKRVHGLIILTMISEFPVSDFEQLVQRRWQHNNDPTIPTMIFPFF
jgi:hypothetical protein